MARPRKSTKAAEVTEAVVEVKETVEEVTAVQTEEVKETKKPATKKTATKKEVNPTVVFQFSGKETDMNNVVENVKKAFEAEGHRVSTIKELRLYVKPEENAAYYVINEKYDGKVDLF